MRVLLIIFIVIVCSLGIGWATVSSILIADNRKKYTSKTAYVGALLSQLLLALAAIVVGVIAIIQIIKNA